MTVSHTFAPADDLAQMTEEAVQFCAELIRIDSTNTGDPATIGSGETRCALYIRKRLEEVGYTTEWYERAEGRGNLVLRITGANVALPGLLVHGHTDVVPAERSDWSVDPFAGEIRDGFIWGRGAVDMKDMLAMTLATLRQFKRDGFQPQRDLVITFVADEEVDGSHGMDFLVTKHPEIFTGVTEAIGELGGFSVELSESLRLYLVGIAEKGVAWATLTATGTTGHGSIVPNSHNAVAHLAAALGRIAAYEWPIVWGEAVTAFVDGLERALVDHLGRGLDRDDIERELDVLGHLSGMLGASLKTTTAPTQMRAGYKTNIVPGEAVATVDCRVAAGTEPEFKAIFASLVGEGISIEWIEAPSVEAAAGAPIMALMQRAISAEDNAGTVVPYVSGGATDAKSLTKLGIDCYGFSPLRLPPNYVFSEMFHGIDERVPVDAVRAGSRILHSFLTSL
jgi:acetylornithine deacetylase/succinyl-diaminopimelate desuccinylase-like protein